jgi:hypothetical protein
MVYGFLKSSVHTGGEPRLVCQTGCACFGQETITIDSHKRLAEVEDTIASRLEDKTLIGMPVGWPFNIAFSHTEIWFFFADSWYHCQECGAVWEFVRPDFPAKGFLRRLENKEPSFSHLKLSQRTHRVLRTAYVAKQKDALNASARLLGTPPVAQVLSTAMDTLDDELRHISIKWRLNEILEYTKELQGMGGLCQGDISLRLRYMFFELSEETTDALARYVLEAASEGIQETL